MAVSVYAWLRKYLTVEPVMFLYMGGALLQYPVVQQLAYQKICLKTYNNTVLCNNLTVHKTEEKYVESKASEFILYVNIAMVIPSILMMFLLGSWTDKFGRKTAMVLPSIGALVGGTNLIIQSVYFDASLSYLFIGAIAAGLTGGYACVLMTCYTYIVDVTDITTRTWRIGVLEAVTMIGTTVGSAVGGALLDRFGFVSVFITYLAMNVTLILYVVVWLKETVQKNPGSIQEQEKDSVGSKIRGLLNIENVKMWGMVICKRREKRGRLHIILLLLTFFINIIAFMGWSDIGLLFTKHQLGSAWSNTLYGVFLAVNGVMSFLGLMVILPFVSRVLCDTKVGQLGMISRAAASVLLAYTTTVWMLFLVPVVNLLSGFGGASLRCLLSKEVEAHEKGALFSVVSSVEVLCQGFSSILYNKLYPATLSFFPGLSYVLMAASLMISFLLLQWLEVDVKNVESDATKEEKGNIPDADEDQPLLRDSGIHCDVNYTD